MADDAELQALSAEEIAALDAAYKPFPAFEDWPQNSVALAAWQRSCDRFRDESALTDEEVLARAREIALRAAAFDTGAIEGLYATSRGLTFTVAEQAALWEQKVETQGPDALVLFEAQLRAFELVLDHVTSQVPEITQAWIRRIHEEITAPQETYLVHTAVGTQKQALPRGEYKTHPNHVRTRDGDIHAYAPVASTSSEMKRLLSELERPEFKSAHPIIKASYLHYAFVAVHPFADGNGRVARALASVFTYQSTSVPLLILHEDRDTYFASLAAADAGDAQPFVDFIGKVARDAVELVADNLKTALSPQPEEILRQFDESNRLDPTSRERNEIALELGRWINSVADELVANMEGESVSLTAETQVTSSSAPPDGFREIPGHGTKGTKLTATAIVPRKVQVSQRIDFFISDDPNAKGMLLVQPADDGSRALSLDLEELWPSASALAQHRMENFFRRNLGEILKLLQDEALSGAG